MARRKQQAVTDEPSPVSSPAKAPAPYRVFDLFQPTVYESGGVTRTSWTKVGTLIDRGHRVSVRLGALPLGSWNGWLQGWPRKSPQVERPARGRKRKQEGA